MRRDWVAVGKVAALIGSAVFFCMFIVACESGNAGMNGLEQRKYTASLVITETELNAQFAFGKSPDEVEKWCAAFGKPQTFAQWRTGCAMRPSHPKNSTGKWLIYAVAPTDWNDTASLANLGHEVAHALGATHE